MRRILLLAVTATTAALGPTANAGPPVPAPTASATFQLPNATEFGGPDLGRSPQPRMTAGWAVAKPGHDATLTISGDPVPVLSGYGDALWTSAPLRVVRKGNVATLTIAWSGIQYDQVDENIAQQQISVRFTDAKGRWGSFVPILDQPLTQRLDTGTVRSLVVPVTYRGPVPISNLQVQVKVADTFTYVARLTHTVRVRA